MSTHYFTILARDYQVFVGMDVDKRSISITVLTHEDAQPYQRKLPYNAANVLALIAARYPGKRVVFCYEAGPTGYGLYDKIVEAGHTCLVVPPATVPKAPSERVKTNRTDSRKLAYELRGGKLHGIHVPSLAFRYLRYLIQLREVLLGQVVGYKNRIKALLLMESIPFPPVPPRSQWSLLAIREIHNLNAPLPVRMKLDHLLRELEFSKTQLKEVTKSTVDFCIHDPELSRSIHLLCTIPGIGMIVAMHLLARIGNWRYLQTRHQIAGLLGLIPTENTTGDRVNRGSITRLGDAAARNKLIETAWTAIKKDSDLKEFFQRVCSKHPAPIAKRKAIVAVARKLTVIIFVVLTKQRPYLSKEELIALQGKTRR
jgi:transposase